MGTQMRCRCPPRRDHCSIFGRNRSNPFAASWSWTSCSQWLRVHNACHAVDEHTAPAWTAAVSRAGEIESVGIALFIGRASPPLVRGSLSGTNHTHLSSSCFAAGVRRADAPDRLFHRDALREVPGLVHVTAAEHRDVVADDSAHTIWSPFALDLSSPYGRPRRPSRHRTPKSACGNALTAAPVFTSGGRTADELRVRPELG